MQIIVLRNFSLPLSFCLLFGVSPLAAQGLDWSLAYTGDVWRNASGGLERGSRYLDNVDLGFSTSIPADNGLSLPAGEVSGHLLYNNAAQLSGELIGDFQVVSNIDSVYNARLYELWYAFPVGDKHSFKLGVMDLNAEFDAIEPAGLFINSSHGIGPDFAQSGSNGPSIFPSTSAGARYLGRLDDNWSLRVAVFDAVPGDLDNPRRSVINLSRDEGALLVSELNLQRGDLRFGLGSWLYTNDAPRLSRPGAQRNRGLYAFVEAPVDQPRWDRPAWWLRLGQARESVNPSEFYLGAGLVFPGLGDRAGDTWGVAVAHARASDRLSAADLPGPLRPTAAETALELTYRWVLSPRLSLQPDLQLILDPGFSPRLDDAWLFGLRLSWQVF